jgi:hypothetical protein
MADVISGAVTGGLTGGGVGAVLGGGSALLGNLFGSDSASKAAQKAKEEYAKQAQLGINTLSTGMEQNTANQTPFIQAGQTGATGVVDAITGRTQAAQPTLSESNPNKAVSDYLNPSSAYTTRLANDAIQAKALAGGASGGGMMKALSDNANKMAMTNYNNAYQQMLDTGTQKFGQEQQQYTNKTGYDQSQINNYQNLMNAGETAAANTGTTNLQYNNNLNQAYENLGQSNAGAEITKGNIGATSSQNSGNLIGGMLQNSGVGSKLASLFGG